MKRKLLLPVILLFLMMFASPVYAGTGKIHSLSLSTLSVTKNSQEEFYWLMCNNKLKGYSNSKKDQHAYYSEAITSNELEKLLDNAFASSTDRDINFFYFTGHTIFESLKPIADPLGININVQTKEFYPFRTLAKKLNSYKGRMVVILDTCGSEAFITDGISSLSDTSRISAVCSCGYLEESEFGYWYVNPYLFVNGYKYNAFTYALGKGLGFFDSSRKLYADSDGNGGVSIQELFQYTQDETTSLNKMSVKMFSNTAFMDIFSYSGNSISLGLSETNISLYKGKSRQLHATVTGTKKKPTWKSSNKSVVTVNSKGKITAKKKGTATITCKVGAIKATCKISVLNPVKVKIALNKTKLSMYVGDNFTLKAKVTGTTQNVKWSSSNSKIAKVSNGNVTGLKAGTVNIISKVAGKKAICKITIKKRNTKKEMAEFKKIISQASWWTDENRYCFGISNNHVLIGNTYGKLLAKYKINYIQKTSYGFFINIKGYNNYRWYRSNPSALVCYSSATGEAGRNEAADFWGFGC